MGLISCEMSIVLATVLFKIIHMHYMCYPCERPFFLLPSQANTSYIHQTPE